jgi:hypothetical protein
MDGTDTIYIFETNLCNYSKIQPTHTEIQSLIPHPMSRLHSIEYTQSHRNKDIHSMVSRLHSLE